MNRLAGHFLLLFVFIFSLFSCSSDDRSKTTELEAEFHENVSYGTLPEQIYDIYLPAGRSVETTKTLILVHGGFWTSGDKSDLTEYMNLLRETFPEYAIVNMNYVLATSSTAAFPNQFEDMDLLINRLTSQKEDLQILPEFGLVGVSSGAHISLQYDYVYDTDDQVKMVCDIVGPTDFTDPFYTEQAGFENLVTFLVDEEAFPENTDYTVVLSPAYNVSSMSSPTILFYGEEDELVPTTNAYALETALENAGITHSLTFYPGGHGDWSEESFEDLKVKLKGFIQTHFEIL